MDAKRMNTLATNMVDVMNQYCIDREQEIRGMIVALFAGEHLYVGGPPGSGKTYMGKVMNSLIAGSKDYSMTFNAFSTPDEVVGPFNPAEIMKGEMIRKIDGKLADCHFGRLEEIFKSNAGCLGILTDILIDGCFVQNGKPQSIPLLQALATSNELPMEDSLAYLWDRFAMRYWVDYLSSRDDRRRTMNFRKGVQMPSPICTVDEVISIRQIVKDSDVSEELQDILLDIQDALKREGFIISDRRMGRIQEVCHAEMVVFGTDACDAALHVSDMIWNRIEDIQKTRTIVTSSANPSLGVVQAGFDFIMTMKDEADHLIEKLRKEISGATMSKFSEIRAKYSGELVDMTRKAESQIEKMEKVKLNSKTSKMVEESRNQAQKFTAIGFDVMRGKVA